MNPKKASGQEKHGTLRSPNSRLENPIKMLGQKGSQKGDMGFHRIGTSLGVCVEVS